MTECSEVIIAVTPGTDAYGVRWALASSGALGDDGSSLLVIPSLAHKTLPTKISPVRLGPLVASKILWVDGFSGPIVRRV